MTDKLNKVRQLFLAKEFLPVTGESYSLFRSYERDNRLQEKSAVITAAWSGAHRGLYKIIHGYLCNVYFYDELPVYFVIHRPAREACPIKPIVDLLYDLSMELGLPFLQLRYIEDRCLKEYQEIAGYDIRSGYKPEDNEYAYPVAELVNLTGSENYYKRKRIRKFDSLPNITLGPMTKENVHLCLKIESEWCLHQDCTFCSYFCGCEKEALENMVVMFDERFHLGLFLYSEAGPAGYIICEKKNEHLAFLYFGKVNLQDGFVYLIYTMFRDYLNGVEYMNINDEMGNAGLRQFKVHLSAHDLWKRNFCTYLRKEDRNHE
jgi:hypothetical protein